MFWILIVMYVWAGATLAFAIWLFEDIGQALNSLPHTSTTKPFERKMTNNRVIILVALLWPIALPMWATIHFYERSFEAKK